jgi:hypothetical protein
MSPRLLYLIFDGRDLRVFDGQLVIDGRFAVS